MLMKRVPDNKFYALIGATAVSIIAGSIAVGVVLLTEKPRQNPPAPAPVTEEAPDIQKRLAAVEHQVAELKLVVELQAKTLNLHLQLVDAEQDRIRRDCPALDYNLGESHE